MPGITVDPSTSTIVVSQSWLKTFLVCPERARREVRERTSSNSDATARGHAIHRYMESRLRGVTRKAAMGMAMERLHHLIEQDDFQWIQVKRQVTLERHVTNLLLAYERHVLPQVPMNGLVEHTMTAPVGVFRGWDVHLTGTPDYIAQRAVFDWKTSGRVWNRYETVNWDIQSTCYTFLAQECLGVDVRDFTFIVGIVPHGDLQIIDLARHEGDWLWLKRQIAQAVTMLDVLPTDEWVTNHQHWLCSSRWCPFWDTCRGPHKQEDEDASDDPQEMR